MPGPGFGGGMFGAPVTTIRDEGVPLPQRYPINFSGAGVTATDDAISGETDVVIPGVSGSLVVTRRTVTPPYTVAADDSVVHVGAAGTVTLPPNADGRTLRIKKIGVAGDVTLVAPSGTLDGAASLVLSGQYQSVDLVGDGTNWSVH